MRINNKIIDKYTSCRLVEDQEFSFDQLALVDTVKPNSLSFLDEKRFTEELIGNPNITGVIIHEKLVDSRFEGRTLLLSEDPRYDYYNLINQLGKANYKKFDSEISSRALIHPSAVVSDYNVVIEDGVIIEPNTTVLPDVKIGENSIIRAGAVIGSEGFEHKRTTKGVLSVWHDGKVVIGSNVEIGANTCIDKGFSSLATTIGDYTKVDSLVHIAHGVTIGKSCFVVASSMLAGGVVLKDNVWIGPNANLSNAVVAEENAYVTMGSVVTKSIDANERVTGNFALPHKIFISNLKAASQKK